MRHFWSEASKLVIGPAPLLPARMLAQLVSTSPPSGVTRPSPVTTTRRIEFSKILSLPEKQQAQPRFGLSLSKPIRAAPDALRLPPGERQREGPQPLFSSMYLMASLTVVIFSAASSGISTPNSSSNAMTSSTMSRLSAPRSSMKLASSVTLSASTPRCSTTIFFTRSAVSLIAYLSLIGILCLVGFALAARAGLAQVRPRGKASIERQVHRGTQRDHPRRDIAGDERAMGLALRLRHRPGEKRGHRILLRGFIQIEEGPRAKLLALRVEPAVNRGDIDAIRDQPAAELALPDHAQGQGRDPLHPGVVPGVAIRAALQIAEQAAVVRIGRVAGDHVVGDLARLGGRDLFDDAGELFRALRARLGRGERECDPGRYHPAPRLRAKFRSSLQIFTSDLRFRSSPCRR